MRRYGLLAFPLWLVIFLVTPSYGQAPALDLYTMEIRCLSASITIGEPFFLELRIAPHGNRPVVVVEPRLDEEIKLAAVVHASEKTLVNSKVEPLAIKHALFCGLDGQIGSLLEPGHSRSTICLIDPWSDNLIDFVLKHSTKKLGLRTTVSRFFGQRLASYSPYRLDLTINHSVLDRTDIVSLQKTTTLSPVIADDVAARLAQRSPESVLLRNLRIGQQVFQIVESEATERAAAELGRLIAELPSELRAWYRQQMLQLIRQKHPDVSRLLTTPQVL